MKFEVEIKKIEYYYSEKRKRHCLYVVYQTKDVNGSTIYSGKTLNQAKKQMYKKLHEDLLAEQVNYEMKDVFKIINKEE